MTDLDHDQVVRHVGLSKSKLILQVTKLCSELPAYGIDARRSNKAGKGLKQIHGKKVVSSSGNKKLKNNGVTQSDAFLKPNVPPPPPYPPPPILHHQKSRTQQGNNVDIMMGYPGGGGYYEQLDTPSFYKKFFFHRTITG